MKTSRSFWPLHEAKQASSTILQDDGLKVGVHKVRVAAYKVDQYCPPLGERRRIKKKVRFKLLYVIRPIGAPGIPGCFLF